MINGRIAAVQEIGRMVARLRLSREERADVIAAVVPGERTLVKLDACQLASVRERLEGRLRDRAEAPA